MQLPVVYLNAFPNRPFSGNPAAVCRLNSWLDDGVLRKVAAENNLSATAFLVPRESDYEIRWFTQVCELKLCGHGTFASGYVALHLLHPELASIGFATRWKGTVSVRKEGDMLAMDFPALVPERLANVPDKLIRAFRGETAPSEVLEVNQTYVAIFDSEEAIQNMRPDAVLMEQLKPYAVSVSAPGKQSDIVSRFFAPAFGLPEDPVTGSAHSILTPYWTKRLGKSQLHARQLSQRGGELWCEIAAERVILRGKAVLTMKGMMEI